MVVAGRGNGFSISSRSFQSPPPMIAVAEPAAQAAVPVVAVPVEAVPVVAVPVVAVPVVAAAEAAVPVVAAAELTVDAAGGAAPPGSEYAAAADTGLGTRDERQLERYRRLRDESLREPDISLEAVGHQRAGHVPYGNLSKNAQRNYIAALQENSEDEAAARAHIYSPGERPYVDTPINYLLTNSRREAIINYHLTHSDAIAVWNDIHSGSDEDEQPHYWPVDDML